MPHPAIEINPIPKHGTNYSHSYQIGINELELPENALMPPLDMGWYPLLDTLNAERMSFTTAAIGIAKLAISKAVDYSKQRKIFGDVPIGSYQGLQFPLAEAYAALEAAKLMNFKAASLFDSHASRDEVGAAASSRVKSAPVKLSNEAVHTCHPSADGFQSSCLSFSSQYAHSPWAPSR